jgi:hypothetical protein
MKTTHWKTRFRERIAKGNAFYMNKTLFTSKLVSRKSKLKFYWSVIRPIIVYCCETRVLKESIIQRLSVFEWKILRKIFGPTKEDNSMWRIKKNMEFDELIKHWNITNYVKSQRLSWFGHINIMPETSVVKKIYKWKPFIGRPAGRPKSRWEDDIRNDMRRMQIVKWPECVQDRPKWKVIIEKAKTPLEL